MHDPECAVAEALAANPFLTVRQTADFLQIHPHTVRRYIWAGTLPAVTVGEDRGTKRVIRIRYDDVVALLHAVETRPAWHKWAPRNTNDMKRIALEHAMAVLTDAGYELDMEEEGDASVG